MKIIGFSFEEISGKKATEIRQSTINTDIVFDNVEKAKIEIVKDEEALRIAFTFKVTYKDSENKITQTNEVLCKGSLLLMVSKDESKEFIKLWKSKQVPKDKIVPLYNFILRKCSLKALSLEEDLGLQPHIPFPHIRNQPQDK